MAAYNTFRVLQPLLKNTYAAKTIKKLGKQKACSTCSKMIIPGTPHNHDMKIFKNIK